MHVPEQSHHETRQYPVSYKVSQTGIHVCGGRILHQAEISRKERGMGCGREGERTHGKGPGELFKSGGMTMQKILRSFVRGVFESWHVLCCQAKILKTLPMPRSPRGGAWYTEARTDCGPLPQDGHRLSLLASATITGVPTPSLSASPRNLHEQNSFSLPSG